MHGTPEGLASTACRGVRAAEHCSRHVQCMHARTGLGHTFGSGALLGGRRHAGHDECSRIGWAVLRSEQQHPLSGSVHVKHSSHAVDSRFTQLDPESNLGTFAHVRTTIRQWHAGPMLHRVSDSAALQPGKAIPQLTQLAPVWPLLQHISLRMACLTAVSHMLCWEVLPCCAAGTWVAISHMSTPSEKMSALWVFRPPIRISGAALHAGRAHLGAA